MRLVQTAQGVERISRRVAYTGSDLECARRTDMSDEKRCMEVPDPNRIDIHDALAMHNWSRSLNATPDELRLAIAKVGPFVEKVCEYLRTY